MDSRNERLLVNYLDRTLEESEMREIEQVINTDTEVHKQWQFLQLAVQAVEYAALFDQVAAVKEQYKAVHSSEVIPMQKTARVVMMRSIYRVAACVLFLIVAAGGFKYVTTSSKNLYKDAFVPYTLGTSRGNSNSNAMEDAYRNKNWNEVISSFNKTIQKDNNAFFLCGMANMQLQQFAAASEQFKQVLANNAQTGDDYFHDEAQYYLAMSLLANNQAKEAITIINQIRADKNHLYYQQADRISSANLRILEFKSGK